MLDLVGDTPLVGLPRLTAELKPKGEVVAKLEFFNPLSSVKDRIGVAMVEALEAKGLLKEGSTIIEPTSGNTGIALAFVAAAKGYKIILVMPESMSIERRKMLLLLGARIELTPAEKGMRGAVGRAQELLEEIPGSVMPQQFENEANPAIHKISTAEEIWNDTGGRVDAVVSGVGTGGTITGVGQALKAKKPSVKMIALEPEASPILSGGEPGPHKIQGIGAGFVPGILDRGVIDEVMTVGNDEAFEMARHAAKTEGLPGGNILRRCALGGLPAGGARRLRGQADRGDHPELCRAVSVDGPVRGALATAVHRRLHAGAALRRHAAACRRRARRRK